jgi:uncharacterized protein (TIGR03435 family)
MQMYLFEDDVRSEGQGADDPGGPAPCCSLYRRTAWLKRRFSARNSFGEALAQALAGFRGCPARKRNVFLLVTRRKCTLFAVRALPILSSLAFLSAAAFGQSASTTTSFDVASVKPSQRRVGPDYNNQLGFSEVGLKARNATLRRLVAEAYHVQLNQVIGQNWLDQNEYDIEAQAGRAVAKEELVLMLRSLLADRFGLKQHGETRNMRAYELVIDKTGPKIQPAKAGEAPRSGNGIHFHGDMRQLADLIAIQLNIPAPADPTRPAIAGGAPAPVLDKTALSGIYDFNVDIRPELGTDGFAVWQRVLQDQLGLKLDSRRGEVPVVVVDSASRIPTGN